MRAPFDAGRATGDQVRGPPRSGLYHAGRPTSCLPGLKFSPGPIPHLLHHLELVWYNRCRRNPKIMKKPCEIVASRDEAIHKMRAAADRNLSDMYTEQERQAWAERTADA